MHCYAWRNLRTQKMKSLNLLRIVGLFEGASFLLLLFIAMPMKYLLDMPLAVRIVGSAHGALFMAYLYFVFSAATEHEWPLKRWAYAFIASVVPFGPMIFDRSLKEEMEALKSDAQPA